MRVLALDTTARAGSVALVIDGRVVEERRGDPARTHAERLPGDLTALLDDYALKTGDIDLFAVASGPGLFTGLRIGIATVQGLAFVHHRKIAAVSAFEALAHMASADLAAGALVAVWMDAQRRDVFTAAYRVAPFPAYDPARLLELESPAVGEPAATLDRWRRLFGDEPMAIAGDGAVQWSGTIGAAFKDARIMPPPALAGAIGRIALAHDAGGLSMRPDAVRPLYVRRPDAEIERDKRVAKDAERAEDAKTGQS